MEVVRILATRRAKCIKLRVYRARQLTRDNYMLSWPTLDEHNIIMIRRGKKRFFEYDERDRANECAERGGAWNVKLIAKGNNIITTKEIIYILFPIFNCHAKQWRHCCSVVLPARLDIALCAHTKRSAAQLLGRWNGRDGVLRWLLYTSSGDLTFVRLVISYAYYSNNIMLATVHIIIIYYIRVKAANEIKKKFCRYNIGTSYYKYIRCSRRLYIYIYYGTM